MYRELSCSRRARNFCIETDQGHERWLFSHQTSYDFCCVRHYVHRESSRGVLVHGTRSGSAATSQSCNTCTNELLRRLLRSAIIGAENLNMAKLSVPGAFDADFNCSILSVENMGTDAGMALQLLRAKQNAYYIQAVQDALQSEEQRKQKLHKASNKQEAKRLESQFTRERSVDRERLRHIQEDHALLLNTKIAEWKTTGGVKNKQSPEAVASKQRTERQTAPHKVNFTKVSMERLAAPRVTTIKPELADDRHSTFNSRGGIESTQALEFYKNVYRKQDRERLSRNAPPPQTLTTTNLRTMSETELLRKKANLLSELHGVVSLEARLIQDDQCTVRSSVSSWKSTGCT